MMYEVVRYAADGHAGEEGDGAVLARGTLDECREAVEERIGDSGCRTCVGRPGRTSREVQWDERRQRWMVYRGGWYPCPTCYGTGNALGWAGAVDDVEAYHESGQEGCGGWAIRLVAGSEDGTTRYLVWGVGAASSPLLREAPAVQGSWPSWVVGDIDVRTGGDFAGGWCVMVAASADEVDAATRFDAAVLGYATAPGDD